MGYSVRKLDSYFNLSVLALLFFLFGAETQAQVNANFTANQRTGCSPLTVRFTDLSTGDPDLYFWDFGNGNTSTFDDVVATYDIPGTYTVRLTVVDTSGGFTDTRTEVAYIRVYADPTANFTQDTTNGCAPLSINFSDASSAGSGRITAWEWDFGDGIVDTARNPNHIYLTTGSYSVILVVTDTFGCRDALTRNDLIDITEIANVDFIASPANGCAAPLNVNFTSSINPTGSYTYLWDFGDGATSTAANPSHTYIADGSYTVSLTVIDNNGCQEQVEKTEYIVIDNPVAAFRALDTSICSGRPIQFINQSTGANSYNWSFGNGNTSTEENPTVSFAAPGTYSVTLNAINTAGCNDILSRTGYINVYATPAPSFTAQPSNTGCDSPLFVSFVDNSIGNVVSWQWDFGNGHISSSATPTTTYLNEGLYDVSLTVTTADGCQATESIPNYIQLAQPDVDFAASVTEGCAPLNVAFTNLSTSTADPITTYLWNFGDGSTSGQANPNHSYVNSGIYDVRLTVITQSGCSETMTFSNITVGDTPLANFIANPRVVCVGQNVDFASTSLGNPLQYYWSLGDGGSAFVPNPIYAYGDTGTFGVQLIISNFGCRDTFFDPAFIQVEGAVAGFDARPEQACNPPTTVLFTDNSVNASRWYWNFGDGNTDSVANPSHVFNSVGTFTVTQVVTDTVSGCSEDATFDIVITEPQAGLSADQNYGCAPFQVNFTNSSVDANTFIWDFGDGNISTNANPSHTYQSPGVYTVSLYASDGTCGDTLIMDSLITVAGPEADFDALNLTGCAPLSTTFSDLSVNNPGAPLVSWQWSFGDGNSGSGPNPGHTYNQAGDYDVRLIVLDADGCVDTVSKAAFIQPTFPRAAFTTTDSTSCPGSLISFVNQSSGLGVSYLWDFGDGNTSTTPNPFHLYPNNGSYNVSLSVTDVNGCTDTEIKTNYVSISKPIANFTADTSSATCPPLTVSFTDQSNALGGTINSWLWDFGDGSNSTLANPQKIFNSGGDFDVSLIVGTRDGCRDTLIRPSMIQITGPSGSFSMSPSEGCQPLDVNFSVISLNPSWIYNWDFGDGTGGTGTTVTHRYFTDTTISPLLLVEDSAGCIVPIRSNNPVIIRPRPEVAFTSNQSEICLGESVSFTNQSTSKRPVVSYEWDFGDGNLSNLSNPSHVYTDTGAYQVQLRVFTLDGCTDTASAPIEIRVTSPPVAAFTPSPDAGCNPTTVSFLEASSGYFPIVDWTWNFGDGVGDNGQFIAPHSYTNSGVYQASLTVRDTRGCTGTTTQNVTIYPLPDPDFSAFRYGCAPISVSFSDLTSGSANIVAWEWNFGDGLTSTDQNPVHIYANDGLYTVTLTVTDDRGCQQTIVKPAYIRLARPSVNFTSNAGVSCPPQQVEFRDLSLSDTTLSYRWNFGDGSPLATAANPIHTFYGPDTFDVELIVSDLFGCRDTLLRPQHVITQNPPSASFSVSDSAACVPQNIVFTSTSSGNDGATVTAYRWGFGAGSGGNTPSTSFLYTNPGTYNASLEIIDDNGCRDTAYKTINIFPNPQVDFVAGDTMGCSVTSIQFFDLSTGAFAPVSWNWDFGDGSIGSGQNPVHTYVNDGQYTVSLEATDVNGCSATATKTNYIRLDHPSAAFSSSSIQSCPGETISFRDNSFGPLPLATWRWDFGDGSPLGTAQNPSHVYTTAGSYTVTLTIMDVAGCSDTIHQSIPIEIYSPPVADFTYSPNRGCESLTVNFTNTSTAGSAPIVSSYWIFGDGAITGVPNPTHVYSNPGLYNVSLVLLDANGCQDTLTQVVEVLELPEVNFVAVPPVSCAPQTLTFIDSTQSPYTLVGWEWDFGDGNTSTSNQPVHMYTADGLYTVQLVVTDINGCKDSLIRNQYIRLAHPVADFTIDRSIVCPNEPIGVTFTDASTHDTTLTNWQWDFGDGNGGSGQVVAHSYASPGTYTVTLRTTDILGCQDVDTMINVVRVRNAPQTAFNISDSANCTPLTAQLTDTSLPGDGNIVDWDWDFGNGDGSLQQNPLYTWSTPGTYTLSLTTTDIHGCSSLASKILEAFEVPVSDFYTADTLGCAPATITFNNLTNSAQPVSLRKWYFGDGDSAINIVNPTHTYQNDGNYSVSLISVDQNGCVDTTVKPNYIRLSHPVAQFSFDQSEVCPNVPVGVSFTDQSIPEHPLVAWNWNFGDGNSSSLQNPTHSYASPGNYPIVLEVTNIYGCIDRDTFPTSITVLNPPLVSFTVSDSADCTPFSLNLTDASGMGDAAINTWEWDFGDGNQSFLQNTNHTYGNPGIYEVELKVTDANGCQDSANLSVEAYRLPDPDFVANDSLGCSGQVFNFTDRSAGASMLSTWEWDFGDGNTSNLRNPSHTYVSEGSYSVSLRVTDVNGCSRTLTKTNYINLSLPVADFNSDIQEACPGTNINFSDLSLPDHPIQTWKWDFGDGNTSTLQNPVHAYVSPGVYTVSLVITNSYGCRDTLSKANYIRIFNGPTPQFTLSDTAGCAPLRVNFTNTSVGNSAAISSLRWDFGNGDTAISQTPAATFLSSGNYTVALQVTDGNGCQGSVSRSVEVFDNPDASFFAVNNSGCPPLAVSFGNTSSGPVGLSGFEWDFGDGNSSNISSPNHVYGSMGIYDVRLIVTDLNGCRDTMLRNDYVEVRRPQADFQISSIDLCEGEQVTFSDNSIPDTTLVDWRWDFGDGNSGSGATATHIYTSSGTYTVSLIVENVLGCTDTVFKTNVVQVADKPDASFVLSDTAGCTPFSLILTNTSTANTWPITAYEWQFGDGNGAATLAASHTYTQAGIYEITLVARDQNACTDTARRQVISRPLPNSDFATADSVGCAPRTVNFQNSSGGAAALSDYFWDFGDGNTSNAQFPSHTYTANGVYDVSLTVEDVFGCRQTLVRPNYIRLSEPVADFIQSASKVCPGIDIIFTDASLADTSLIGWGWDFGDGSTGNGPSIPHRYTQPGFYTVSLTVTNVNGCSDSRSKTAIIEVVNGPQAAFAISDTVGCTPLASTLTDTSIPGDTGIVAWSWDFGNGLTGSGSTESELFTLPGSYDVQLIVRDRLGCEDTTVRRVEAIPLPQADFSASSTLGCDETITFFDDTQTPANIVAWEWDFGDGNSSNLETPTHTYTLTGSYTVSLVVTDNFGCTDTIVKPDYINLTRPIAIFAQDRDEVCPGGTIQFFDFSIPDFPIVSRSWNFGDGTTATGSNPLHTYDQPGIYTVTLTIVNTQGCTDSESGTIEVFAPPTAQIGTSITEACAPLTLDLENLSILGGGPLIGQTWDFGDGRSSSQSNPSLTYTQAGDYRVSLAVVDANGCAHDTSILIRVNEVPQVDFTADGRRGCAPQSINFQAQVFAAASIQSWNWDFGDGNTSNQENPSHVYTSDGTYDVKLVVVDANGCTDSLTKTQFIRLSHPQAAFSHLTDGFCPPVRASFEDQSIEDTTLTSWNWNFGDGSTSNQENPVHIYPNSGNYSVRLIVGNVMGCRDTLLKPSLIQVNEGPTASFTPGDTANCTPLSINFASTAQAGDAPIDSYEWDFGNGLTSTQVNPVMTFGSPGTYDVSLIVADDAGCRDTTQAEVRARALPRVDFSVSDTLGCAPKTINFFDQSIASGAIVSWFWDFGDGNTSNAQFPIHTYAANGNYDVSLTIEDEFGCVQTLSRPDYIRLGPPEVIFSLSPANICPGTEVSFTDFSQTVSDVVAWNWDFGDGNTSTQKNPQNTYDTPGGYTVSLTISDASGCVTTLTKVDTIEVYSPPVASFNPSEFASCPPLNASFANTSSNGSSPILNWEWDLDDGVSSVFTNPSRSYANPGNYDIRLIVTDGNGCRDTASEQIQVYEPPRVYFLASDSLGCSPFAVTFQDQSNRGDGQLMDWTWSFGDGNGGNGQFPTHTYSSDGIYDVSLVVEDEYGCRDSLVKNNYIRLSHPIADFRVASTQECPGTNISFIDQSIPDTTLTGWLWNFGDGNTSTDRNPVHFYTQGGTYDVSLTVTNILGCSHTFTRSQEVEILDGPQAIFTPSALRGCGPMEVSFVDNSIGNSSPIVAWNWDFGDGASSMANNPVHTFVAPGIYEVELSVTDNNGCEHTFNREIEVLNGPRAAFMSVDTLGCAPATTDFTDLSTGPQSIVDWRWNFGDGKTSDLQFPSHTYQTDGNYDVELLVEDVEGCRDTLLRPQYIRLTNPQADFSMDVQEGCPGMEVSFTDESRADTTLVGWLWDFGDGNTSVVRAPRHVYSSPGTYTVSLTITNVKGCSKTRIIPNAVRIFTPPTADFRVSDSLGCVPFGISMNDQSQAGEAAISIWEWDFGNGDTSMIQEPSYAYSDAGIQSIRMVIEDDYGCRDSLLKEVEAVASPLANFISPDTFGCAPQVANFLDLSTDDTYNIVRWSWTFGDGDSALISQPAHTYQNDGVYTLSLKVENEVGCSDRLEKPAYIRYDHPLADFEADLRGGCPGTLVQFSDLSIGDTTLVAWRWDFGDGNISVQQNPSHLYAQPGNYDVSLFITNIHGCQDSISFDDLIQISGGPVASFLPSDTSNCGPFTATFTDFSSSAVGIADFEWYVDDSLAGRSQNFSLFMDEDGRKIVSLVVEDNNGCRDTTSRAIFLRNAPQVDFSPSDTIGCAPQVISFSDETQHLIESWNWNFGDGTTSTEQNPAHTYDQDGVYTVSLEVVDPFGCRGSMTKVNLINLDHPEADFVAEYQSDCPPVVANFTATANSQSGIAKWDWDYGDGNKATTLVPTASHPYDAAGIYDVRLRVTDSVGCQVEVAKDQLIEVFGDIIPVPIGVRKASVLNGNQVEVTFERQGLEEEFAEYTVYREEPGTGYIAVYQTSYINDTVFIDRGVSTESRSHCYKVTVTNLCGRESLLAGTEAHCTVEARADVLPGRILLRWNPYRGWDEVSQYEIFRVRDYDVANASFIGVVDGSQTSFEEELDDCFNDVSYRVLAIGTTPQERSWSDTTQVLGENAQQAEATAMLRATVEDNRYTLVEWEPFDIPNVSVIYVEKSENGGSFTTYATLPEGEEKFQDLNTDVNRSSYAYRVSAQDSCGNTTSVSDVGKTILLEAGREGSEIKLDWTAYESWRFGVDRYRIERFNEAANQWEVLDFVQGTQQSYLDQSGPLEQSRYCYRVVALERGGNRLESLSNEVCLDFETSVYAASAFTPNGDGVNDEFRLKGFLVDQIEWKVFSRWGLLIYEGKSLDDFWDGTYQGAQVSEGTYVYIAKGTGKNGLPFLFRGSITLLR